MESTEVDEFEKARIETLIGFPSTKWEITSRYNENGLNLCIVNARTLYRDELAEIRGLVIDLNDGNSEPVVIFKRKFLPVFVGDQLSDMGRIVDPKTEIWAKFQVIENAALLEIDKLIGLNILKDHKLDNLKRLAAAYNKGFSAKPSESNEEVVKKMFEGYNAHEGLGKEILNIVNDSTYTNFEKSLVIPLIMNIVDIPAYNFVNLSQKKYQYERCCTYSPRGYRSSSFSPSGVQNCINIQCLMSDILLERHPATVKPYTFSFFYSQLLGAKSSDQVTEIANDFTSQIEADVGTGYLVRVFAKRVFFENSILGLSHIEQKSYYPVFDGYSFTVFNYRGTNLVITHRLFKEFSKDNIADANDLIFRDKDKIPTVKDFGQIDLDDGDSFKVMYVHEKFIMGTKNFVRPFAYVFEVDVTSENAKRTIETYNNMEDYKIPDANTAQQYLFGQDAKLKTNSRFGEALYIKSSDGDYKIHSQSYQSRHKIFSRSITVDGNFTDCILKNFLVAYIKNDESGEKMKAFMEEFGNFTPYQSLLQIESTGKIVRPKEPTKEILKMATQYSFRIAMVYAAMAYYCNPLRFKDLNKSIDQLLNDREMLVEKMHRSAREMSSKSERSKVIIGKAKTISKNSKGEISLRQAIEQEVENENPFSMHKMINIAKGLN